MKKHFIVAIACGHLFSAAQADIARPSSMDETLRLLHTQIANNALVKSAVVDPETSLIAITLIDGMPGGNIAPDNVHRQLQAAASDKERQEVLDHFVDTILSQLTLIGDEAKLPINLQKIYPVFRHRDYLSLGERDPDSEIPLSSSALGDMVVLYVEDSPESVSFVSESRLNDFGLSPDELHNQAMENLLGLSNQVSIEGDWIYTLSLDGFYEGSLLLDNALWQDIALQINGIVMIHPTRDLVAFASSANPEGESFLRNYLAENKGVYAYEISDLIYVWGSDGWVVKE